MIKINHLIFMVMIPLIFISNGCADQKTGNNSPGENDNKPVSIGNETLLLLKDLEENGDYVNSNLYPSLIKASIVNEITDQNVMIIDLRSSDEYLDGHINGAINKSFEDLPAYFENDITPYKFDKIILVCKDGQVSSYTASLMRLMGYGNVYAMRWGMSAWNNHYAEQGWFKQVSGKYESDLEKSTNEQPPAIAMPELNTGMSTGAEIGAVIFKKLFADGTDSAVITAEELFSSPDSYFVINLERKDKYESGHVPGAIRYKPKTTLGFANEMATIPVDKTVVVYCGTGHNSGFAVAYLRLFGYDAKMLLNGNNSFMYNKMKGEKDLLSWLPFSDSEVSDFEVVK